MAREKSGSRFVGKARGYWGRYFATVLLTVITFGIAGPWLTCWFQKWVVGNTELDGQGLYFDGTGWQLVGSWFKWMFFTVITCGIFLIWFPVKVLNWSAKHTHLIPSDVE